MKPMKSLTMAAAFALVAAVCPVVQSSSQAQTAPRNVAKDPTQLPPPLTRFKAQTVNVTLTVEEVVAEISPGVNAWVWTFNGTIPGPMIRVMEGDTVNVTIENPILGNIEPHNVDFHATMGPGGGAAVTSVEPGQVKTFSFKATRTGAYIYHCAGEGMPWEHVSYGMYGLIMVEPVGGLERDFKELYVGQSDWYLMRNDSTSPPQRDFLSGETMVLDEERAIDERPNFYTLNGHTAALTTIHPPMVNQGDKVRVFFVTGGPNKGANFHIIGQIFDKVYTGDPKKFMVNEETVLVPPGSAAVFEMQALVPGKYLLVDHALWRVPMGAAGFLNVMAKIPATYGPNGALLSTGSWPLDLYSPMATGTGH